MIVTQYGKLKVKVSGWREHPVLCVAGLISSFIQNSPQLVFSRIAPELSRLSPRQGWSRIFGSRGRTELRKAIFKFVAFSVIIAILLPRSLRTRAGSAPISSSPSR